MDNFKIPDGQLPPKSLERLRIFQQIMESRSYFHDRGIGSSILSKVVERELTAIFEATDRSCPCPECQLCYQSVA